MYASSEHGWWARRWSTHPGADQIRRLYREIESHEDRLELNLYIVGDSGGEEEGPMAEGSQEE